MNIIEYKGLCDILFQYFNINTINYYLGFKTYIYNYTI